MLMTLMLRDIPVMEFDMDNGHYVIKRQKLLPISMQATPITSAYDFANSFGRWLRGRVLPLERENAWMLYNMLHIDRIEDNDTALQICMLCKGVSVLDSYWIKTDPTLSWADVNVRKVTLNDTVFQIALHQSGCTIQGALITPEYTTNGTYAKAWRRYNDGLYLLKKSGHDRSDAIIEEFVSNILDKMTVEYVPYIMVEDNGIECCACPCIATENLSVVPARDYHGIKKKVTDLDLVNFSRMCVVDYLIMNADRHSCNYGLYYSSVTNAALFLHPLFDHNKALHPHLYSRKDYMSATTGKSMRDTALKYIKYADLSFTDEFYPSDFPEVQAYDEFMRRAEELKIPTVKNNAKDIWLKLREEQPNANEWDLRVAIKLKYKEPDLFKALQKAGEDMLSN